MLVALVAIIALQITLLTTLVLFILRLASIIISRGMDVPFVPTPRRYHSRIADALQIRPGDVVYDLGCGNGLLLTYCAARNPAARFVGVERSRLLYYQAKIFQRLLGNPQNLSFCCKNFYTSDFSDATRIYAYLLPKIMGQLFGDGAPHARLVSRAFEVPGRTPVETIMIAPRPQSHGQHLLRVYEL